ncbi:cytochrome c maturation protein CcmE [Legionella rowbothamii]|uniref:cytochrome c maturation protein CcmE n=1 Tax=Legionella rowbothamii TaxID=96229 RepID=UPI00105469F1|nr:cytochrome c maturation protein CcmE [Legionella rowbothamii]
MNPARKRKLLILLSAFIALSIASGLVLYALRQNISLFYTPTQIAEGKAPAKQAIRVGGMVEKGSLVRAKEGLRVEFKVTDLRQTITVVHTGILPDLFREGQGVVVEGQLIDNQHVQATRVLAKHDEKYMPPEVKAALAPKVNS